MALGLKTGGRIKGTPNKATAEIKALAREHGPDAVSKLVELMESGESEQVQLGAAKELLDRAYGKATQMIGGDEENPLPSISTLLIMGHSDERPDN